MNFWQEYGNVSIQNIPKYELITLPSLRERPKTKNSNFRRRLRKYYIFVFAHSWRLARAISSYLGMFWDETFLFSCKNFKFKKFALYYFWSFFVFNNIMQTFWTFTILQVKGNVFIQNIPKYELVTLPSLRERAKTKILL